MSNYTSFSISPRHASALVCHLSNGSQIEQRDQVGVRCGEQMALSKSLESSFLPPELSSSRFCEGDYVFLGCSNAETHPCQLSFSGRRHLCFRLFERWDRRPPSPHMDRAVETSTRRGKDPARQLVLELDRSRLGSCANLCVPRPRAESHRAIHLPELPHGFDAQVSSKTLALWEWRRYSCAELSSLQCPQSYPAGYSCRAGNRCKNRVFNSLAALLH